MTEMMNNCFEIDLKTATEKRITVAPPRMGRVFLTKTPKDIMLVKDMLGLMKNLYVIYMMRDPRDIIVSRHPQDKSRYWSNLGIWKRWIPFGEQLRHHPRFITIRYEDLVSKPDETQQQILERMPFLKQTGLFSHFYLKANPSAEYSDALCGLRPVSSDSIGNWRNHKERLAGQIQLYGSISQELVALGYEPGTAWEETLGGIPPDLSESHPTRFDSEAYIPAKLRWNKLRALRVWTAHSMPVLFTKELFYRLNSGAGRRQSAITAPGY